PAPSSFTILRRICLLCRCQLSAPASEGNETFLYGPIDAALGEEAVLSPFSRRSAGKKLHRLVQMLDRIDREASFLAGFHYFVSQHEVLDVRLGDQDPLSSCQTPLAAKIEEALDLFVDAANRLDLAELVDRSGDCKILAQRDLRDGRQQRAKLCGGSTVSFDTAIGLLEHQGRRQGDRPVRGVAGMQQTGKDHHALRVQAPAELGFPLDIDQLAGSKTYPRGDTCRPPKGEVAQGDDGKAIDLADPAAFGIDQQDLAERRLHAFLAKAIMASSGSFFRLADMFRADGARAAAAGQVIGLARQVHDGPQMNRKALCVFSLAAGVLQQASHAAAIKVQELFPPYQTGE